MCLLLVRTCRNCGHQHRTTFPKCQYSQPGMSEYDCPRAQILETSARQNVPCAMCTARQRAATPSPTLEERVIKWREGTLPPDDDEDELGELALPSPLLFARTAGSETADSAGESSDRPALGSSWTAVSSTASEDVLNLRSSELESSWILVHDDKDAETVTVPGDDKDGKSNALDQGSVSKNSDDDIHSGASSDEREFQTWKAKILRNVWEGVVSWELTKDDYPPSLWLSSSDSEEEFPPLPKYNKLK